MARVLIPMIDGFEEIEAITCIDILRRAGAQVITAGIGKRKATGSHDVQVQTDAVLEDIMEAEYDMILLPGGPGVAQLADVAILQRMLLRHATHGKFLAAICAAPSILGKYGLLEGKRAACFPSVENKLGGAVLVREPVVVDGKVITSRGAGTAVPFTLEIVKQLYGSSKAEEISQSIIYTPHG